MKIIIDDLEPNLVEKLKYQAEQNGRTLETELKFILTQAATKIASSYFFSLRILSLSSGPRNFLLTRPIIR